jgi:malate/lactate dehydrogenase
VTAAASGLPQETEAQTRSDPSDAEPAREGLRIAVVGGAGTVGSAVAFHLMMTEPAGEVVLVDADADAAHAQLMDLEHLAGLGARPGVRLGDRAALQTADVVVVAASRSAPPHPDRAAMVTRNAPLLAGLMGDLSGVRGDALVVVATNPVDAVTSLLVRAGVLHGDQVVGFSLNDTLRLRAALARQVGVDIDRIEAWNLGQHGGVQVPVYSTVRVDGRPVAVSDPDRAVIADELANWFRTYQQLNAGRSTGWASAAGICRMIDSWRRRRVDPLPCSRMLEGQFGLHGVALGVPVRFGQRRAVIEEIPLTADELRAMARAAAAVEEAAAELDAAMTAGQIAGGAAC